jgi:aryl-alcohol dehydrogenase-like predicted oxidoreductase
MLGQDQSLVQEAIRFALSHPQISSALVGFGETAQIDEALQALTLNANGTDWDQLLAGEANSIP